MNKKLKIHLLLFTMVGTIFTLLHDQVMAMQTEILTKLCYKDLKNVLKLVVGFYVIGTSMMIVNLTFHS